MVRAQLGFYGCQALIAVRPGPETPEERAAREVQAAEWARRREEARGAEERALALLRNRIGAREVKLLQGTGKLMRPSRLWPGVEYLIPDGGHELIRVVKDGREQTRLCVVAGQGEPWPDRTMAILDLIESGEERKLWEMANVFPTEPDGLARGPVVGREEAPAGNWRDLLTAVAAAMMVAVAFFLVFFSLTTLLLE